MISSTASPVSRRSRAISSRIWSWTVTSSAVVGSSAISSFGPQASAIAIITRCRSPPESSCGYCASRRSGAPMPTCRSTSTSRSRKAPRRRSVWRRSASASCQPTLKAGLRLVIGSWKIMPISRPRMAFSVRRSARARSRPRNRMAPLAIRVGGSGSRRRTDMAVTLLPQPDSPTSPSTSPGPMANETSSTRRTGPASVATSSVRPSTPRSGATASAAVAGRSSVLSKGAARRYLPSFTQT